MGNILGLRFHVDQPSEVEPGALVAVSDPIGPELCDDIEEFFTDLVGHIRDPVTPLQPIPLPAFFFKEYVFEQVCDGVELLRVMYDGAKFHRYYPKAPEYIPKEDFCGTFSKVEVEIKQRRVTLTHFSLEPGTEKIIFTITLTLIPCSDCEGFRVEVFGLNPENLEERWSGQGMAALGQWTLKPMLLNRMGQKVKVWSDLLMDSSGGRSCLTDPLDMFFTCDSFFEALVSGYKTSAHDKGGEVTEKSDTEFLTVVHNKIPVPEQAGKEQPPFILTMKEVAQLDRKDRWLTVMTYLEAELMSTHFWRVHEEPVRCEMWQVRPSGVRTAGSKEGMLLRTVLSLLCAQAEVSGQVASMDEGGNNFYF